MSFVTLEQKGPVGIITMNRPCLLYTSQRPSSIQPPNWGRAASRTCAAQQNPVYTTSTPCTAQKKSRRRAPKDSPRFRLLVHREKAKRNRTNRVTRGKAP